MSEPRLPTEDLKPCPFCGARDPDIRAKTLEPAFSYVHCERCGAQGPCTSDEPHAEIAWNTRQ